MSFGIFKKSKKFYLWDRGCPRRGIDAQKIYDYLSLNGHKQTQEKIEADYLIINTCAFTKEAEEDTIEALECCLQNKKSSAKVILTGCLSKIDPDRLKNYDNVTIITPKKLEEFDVLIPGKVKWNSIQDPTVNYSDKESTKAYLRVAVGCMGACSYCVIKKATGKLVSKTIDQILNQFEHAYANGKREFVLIAEDTGSYGQDIGTSIVELLEILLAKKQDVFWSLYEVNPQWIIKYKERWNNLLENYSSQIKDLIVPVQSGSDNVLQKMRRFYEAKEVLLELKNIKKKYSGIKLITHIMVGFPGETEDDFEKTCSLAKEINFDFVYLYRYSERNGTESVKLDGKIESKIVDERIMRIQSYFKGFHLDEIVKEQESKKVSRHTNQQSLNMEH